MKFCSRCGHANEVASNFCAKCGLNQERTSLANLQTIPAGNAGKSTKSRNPGMKLSALIITLMLLLVGIGIGIKHIQSSGSEVAVRANLENELKTWYFHRYGGVNNSTVYCPEKIPSVPGEEFTCGVYDPVVPAAKDSLSKFVVTVNGEAGSFKWNFYLCRLDGPRDNCTWR